MRIIRKYKNFLLPPKIFLYNIRTTNIRRFANHGIWCCGSRHSKDYKLINVINDNNIHSVTTMIVFCAITDMMNKEWPRCNC